MLYKRIKRIIDKLAASFALVLFVPFFIIIAIILKIDSRGPILFKQERVGYRKNTFTVIKFRTMRIDAPPNSPTCNLNNSDFYITRVGRFLRKTSLDEIPQLLNVLRGDMSIIGPRPVVWHETDLNSERDKRKIYNKVYPGITGLAQIRGRDTVSVRRKAIYDSIYTKNISLKLDAYIFWKTIVSVLKMEGISEGGTLPTHRNFDLMTNENVPRKCIKTKLDEKISKAQIDSSCKQKFDMIDNIETRRFKG